MMQIISSRLRQLRKSKKLTMKRLAEIAGIDYGAYTHYERGDRSMLACTLDLLCKALGTTPNVLMGYEDIPTDQK